MWQQQSQHQYGPLYGTVLQIFKEIEEIYMRKFIYRKMTSKPIRRDSIDSLFDNNDINWRYSDVNKLNNKCI